MITNMSYVYFIETRMCTLRYSYSLTCTSYSYGIR